MDRRHLLFLAIASISCTSREPPAAGVASFTTGEPGRLAAAFAEVARIEAGRTFGVPRLIEFSGTAPGFAGALPLIDVRLRALRGLGRIGDRAATAALVDALQDSDPRIRRQAVVALGMAGAADAEAALIKMYGKHRDAGVPIVEALGRLGSAASLAVLGEALAGDDFLAAAAALSLGWFGRRDLSLDDRARHALAARVKRESGVRVRLAVAFALSREHEPGAAGPEARRAVFSALLGLAMDADPEVRAFALRALAVRADSEDGLSEVLAAALAHTDWRVRVEAVRLLSRSGAVARDAELLARHVQREWQAFVAEGHVLSPRVHVLTEGLRGLAAMAGRVPAALPAMVLAGEALHETAGKLLEAQVDSPDSGSASQPDYLALSTIHCLAAALRVRGGAPLELAFVCGGPLHRGMLEHERRALLAELVVAGFGGSAAERIAVLRELAGHRDSRVRAAVVSAVAPVLLDSGASEELVTGVLPIMEGALADSAVEVQGAAFDALAGAAARPDASRVVAHLVRGPFLRHARAVPENIELAITLMNAAAKIPVAEAVPLCQTCLSNPNVTLRQTARACLRALTGQDPGPGQPVEAPALPPVDPGVVLARSPLLSITTTKGVIDIVLDPDAAPWHVASIIHLVERGFYRDLLWHRVVPDFVVQGGDPDGSGWGGPDFVIPAEPSSGEFVRGTVGIADAGLDTGGSQFFIMHSRAPHLDGRYTIIGRVLRGQDVVDALLPGDRIVRADVRERTTL